MKYRGLLLVIVMLLATACGGGVSESPDGDRSSSGQPTPLFSALPTSPLSPPPTPYPQRNVEGSIAEALQPLVAESLNVNPETLTLLSEERVTWRDMSMGCPQEGMDYAQVIVPGWRVVFVDAAGHEYDVHTAENPEIYVICEPTEAQPRPTAPIEAQGNPAVEASIGMLAENLDVALDAVSVVQVEEVEWRNSCLGCETPGERCLMVITPGYRIMLSSGGTTYEVHTDRTGQRAILCEGLPLPPKDDM